MCAQVFELYQMPCSFSCDHFAPQNETLGIKSQDEKVRRCFGVWVGLEEWVLTLKSQTSSISSQAPPGILPRGQFQLRGAWVTIGRWSVTPLFPSASSEVERVCLNPFVIGLKRVAMGGFYLESLCPSWELAFHTCQWRGCGGSWACLQL